MEAGIGRSFEQVRIDTDSQSERHADAVDARSFAHGRDVFFSNGSYAAATSRGVPLDASVRATMGARFGHDFSAVRVHADERADDDARSLQARAFTVGTHVVFARGAYPPKSSDGLRLIAHELAHVVQQAGRLPTGSVSDRAGEHAADEAAQVVAAGGRVRVSPLAVSGPQRSPDPPGEGPARSPALTPEEMWTQLVQSKRGFESSSSGAGDTHRSSPATAPPGGLQLDDAGKPVAKGAPLGKGYETFAGVQLVDADGNQVAVAADSFHGGGPDNHAEARCVRSLEAQGPARLPGGKLVVVSDQSICPTCRERLLKYAKSRGLTVIEPHEPVRAKMVGTGQATSKTTSRSSTQAGRPQLAVVARKPIPVPSSAPPTPHGAPPAPQGKPPAPEHAPSSKTAPAVERSVVKHGRVSVEVELKEGRPRARVLAIDTKGMARDESLQLSRTPKGSALAKATNAVTMGRTLLDLYASTADEETRTTIEKITHPIQSSLRSKIFDAEKEFLAAHPDPATLASRIDADRHRAVYEAEWRKLSAHRVRAQFAMLGLLLMREDQRGPEWYAALERVKQGAVAPPQEVRSFLDAAHDYEDRAIDVLQELNPHQAGLPQLAADISERARVLDAIAEELETTFVEVGTRFPITVYALLRLYWESQFVAELAGRMWWFAGTVRARHQAYVDLDEQLDAQLRQVGEHIANPSRAIMRAPPRVPFRPR
jgi:hypothetical protein